MYNYRYRKPAKSFTITDRLKNNHMCRSYGIDPSLQFVVHRLHYGKPVEQMILPAIRLPFTLLRAFYNGKPQPQTKTRKWLITSVTTGRVDEYAKPLTRSEKVEMLHRTIEDSFYYGQDSGNKVREVLLMKYHKHQEWFRDDSVYDDVPERQPVPHEPVPLKKRK